MCKDARSPRISAGAQVAARRAKQRLLRAATHSLELLEGRVLLSVTTQMQKSSVGLWLFDETLYKNQVVLDASPNRYDLRYDAGAGRRTGVYGGAVSFDASNAYPTSSIRARGSRRPPAQARRRRQPAPTRPRRPPRRRLRPLHRPARNRRRRLPPMCSWATDPGQLGRLPQPLYLP